MRSIDNSVIEKIATLSGELPEKQKQQLLDLIGSWREDVRQAPRAPYKELLNFTSKKGSHYGHAHDVSASGVFIETTAYFEVGEQVNLVLTFISAPNPVRLTGSVVRKTADGIGVHFDESSQSQVKEMDSIISKHALILRQP
ncbi:PilZ domain protein [Mariprofundus micogutta]|uniref:PilZ domain protein n=1 Tax=Mariprofundus micogutta TaxID=1921010 RepID=A0A1L8CNU6_9PROT|nr:PilZ domain-containing protein [Mariprofundus micogutta]GAV20596.1 PilZ domain protein [Mariprofundus micogutta]